MAISRWSVYVIRDVSNTILCFHFLQCWLSQGGSKPQWWPGIFPPTIALQNTLILIKTLFTYNSFQSPRYDSVGPAKLVCPSLKWSMFAHWSGGQIWVLCSLLESSVGDRVISPPWATRTMRMEKGVNPKGSKNATTQGKVTGTELRGKQRTTTWSSLNEKSVLSGIMIWTYLQWEGIMVAAEQRMYGREEEMDTGWAATVSSGPGLRWSGWREWPRGIFWRDWGGGRGDLRVSGGL